MECNWESRNKLNKGAKTINRVKNSLFISMGYPHVKEWSWTPISHHIQILNQNESKAQMLRVEGTKLRKNPRYKSFGPWSRQWFLGWLSSQSQWECSETRILIYYRKECKMVPLLRKIVRQFLKKCNIWLPRKLKTSVHTRTWTRMLTAALLRIVEKWNSPSIYQLING